MGRVGHRADPVFTGAEHGFTRSERCVGREEGTPVHVAPSADRDPAVGLIELAAGPIPLAEVRRQAIRSLSVGPQRRPELQGPIEGDQGLVVPAQSVERPAQNEPL